MFIRLSTESGSTPALCDSEYFVVIDQFIPASLQSEVVKTPKKRVLLSVFLVVFKCMLYVNVNEEYTIIILIYTHT